MPHASRDAATRVFGQMVRSASLIPTISCLESPPPAIILIGQPLCRAFIGSRRRQRRGVGGRQAESTPHFGLAGHAPGYKIQLEMERMKRKLSMNWSCVALAVAIPVMAL